MNADDDTDAAAIADAQEQADFGAGFEGKPDKPAVEKPASTPAKPELAATRRVEDAPDGRRVVEAKPAPKYIQITEGDWNEVRAAAAKTASYDQQLSKAFGTIGNLSKQIAEQRAAGQPAAAAATARKFEVPKEAFAAMERDFPELAQQTRAALEAALSGLPGPNDAHDPAKLESLLAQYTSKREIEALEDAYPAWRDIVGAVDVTKQQPDPNNPFRKWLASKDPAYQTRINGSESAAVIGRAIRLFTNETKAAPGKATTARPEARSPHDAARTERIRAAVQPRGDNAGAAAGKSDDDEFLSGFNSR